MGFVTAKAHIAATGNGKRAVELEFLVDTGAIYSLVPGDQLRRLGIKPIGKRKFRQASGRAATREVGEARFRIGKSEGISPVIFGRKVDRPLLGVVTLEVLGLEVDPISQELKPAQLLLLGMAESASEETAERLGGVLVAKR